MINKMHCIFLLCFLIGCRKEKHEEEIKYIPQDLKYYAYFKVGTWWVYEEETSHDIDSVIVYSNYDTLITFDGSTGTPEGTYEDMAFKAHSFYDTYNYYYNANTTWTYNGRTPVFRYKTKPGDYIGSTILMFNKFIINDQMPTYLENGVLKLTSVYDSLIIGNINFHLIKIFYDNKNLTEGEMPTNIYLAKNIGIVRREILSKNKIWNLTRFYIVQ